MTVLIFDFDTPIVSAASVCQYNYKAFDEEGTYMGRCVSQEEFLNNAIKEVITVDDPDNPGKTKQQNVYYEKGEIKFEKIAELIDDVDFNIINRGKKILRSAIKDAMAQTGADSFILLVQGANNFRYDIATIQPYKGKRLEKPLLVDALKDWVMEAFPFNAIRSEGEESDDIASRYGWDAWFNRNDPTYEGVIIAHVDKDLDQIPGKHYNFNKMEMYDISPTEACYYFLLSAIQGDNSDNIMGLKELPHHPDCDKSVGQLLGVSRTKRKGVGAVTAKNIMNLGSTPQEWWCIVVWCYKAQWGDDWLKILTENCQLLYLRRQENEMYDVAAVLKRMDLL